MYQIYFKDAPADSITNHSKLSHPLKFIREEFLEFLRIMYYNTTASTLWTGRVGVKLTKTSPTLGTS